VIAGFASEPERAAPGARPGSNRPRSPWPPGRSVGRTG